MLQRYRPDLRLAVMDTPPTGVLVVLGADPTNTVLADRYDEIMDMFLLKDPQQIPPGLIARECAMTPEAFLEAPFWSSLVAARDAAEGSYGREQLLAEVDKALDGLPVPMLGDWKPDPRVGRDDEVEMGTAASEAQTVADVFRTAARKKAEAAAKKDAPEGRGKKATAAAGRTVLPRQTSPPNDLFRTVGEAGAVPAQAARRAQARPQVPLRPARLRPVGQARDLRNVRRTRRASSAPEPLHRGPVVAVAPGALRWLVAERGPGPGEGVEDR